MKKLTKAQLQALEAIRRRNDMGFACGHANLRTRLPTLERLRDAGFIESGRPMPGLFHTIKITDAGRAALSADEAKGE